MNTVTGCSSGLGLALSKHIVKAGHKLVATARKTSSLSYLEESPRVLKLALDVTSTANITSVMAAAIEKFGQIDVVVNNAGYSLMGDTKAASDADARKRIDTNFWGVVDISKEALRIFREVNPKGSGGTLVQVSSMGGFLAFPGAAFYHARLVTQDRILNFES
jgi:NADP-dependent 3-hydroxy acid dehydrogenase YdfG